MRPCRLGSPVAGRFPRCGNRAPTRHWTAGEGTGSTARCYRERGTRILRVHAQQILGKESQETRMQDIPAETKKRGPSSRVLQEVIRQAPAEYVTVGWLTST